MATINQSQKKNKPVKKVLFVSPFYETGGGVGTVTKELQAALNRKGLEVDVLKYWPKFEDKPTVIDSQGNERKYTSLDRFLGEQGEYDLVHFQSDAFSDKNG